MCHFHRVNTTQKLYNVENRDDSNSDATVFIPAVSGRRHTGHETIILQRLIQYELPDKKNTTLNKYPVVRPKAHSYKLALKASES